MKIVNLFLLKILTLIVCCMLMTYLLYLRQRKGYKIVYLVWNSTVADGSLKLT